MQAGHPSRPAVPSVAASSAARLHLRIEQIGRRAPRERRDAVARRGVGHGLASRFRRRREVRRKNDVLQSEKSGIESRFVLVDVHSGATDALRGEGFDQPRIVDDSTARHVDQHRGRFHERDLGRADHVMALRRIRREQHDDIGLAQEIVLAPVVRLMPGLFSRPEPLPVVIEDVHVEAARPFRHGLTDPAEAIVRWVGRHIENEGTWDSQASFALAKGRGSRFALILALADAVGLHVEPVVARSLNLSSAEAAPDIHNFEDYSELVLSFAPDKISGSAWHSTWRHAYPALRYAGLDHLPSHLAGAPFVRLQNERETGLLPRNEQDDRQVTIEAAVAADGGAHFEVEETLLGIPSYEWVESLEQLGDDKKKLNREFERGWLAHHFPGAELKRLVVESARDAPERTRLRYIFNVPRFAAMGGDTLTVRPAFFGSNLGRRFASEAVRTTTLRMTRDIPLTMLVKMRFPAGSRVIDAGFSENLDLSVPGFVFDERRTAAGALGNHGAVVVVERRVRVPIARIAPANYPRVAPLLRKTDQLESSPIRVRLPAPASIGDTGAR